MKKHPQKQKKELVKLICSCSKDGKLTFPKKLQ